MSIRVLTSIEVQSYFSACLRRAVMGYGDARWFSVGTKGPVGVDNPRPEASRWGRE